MVALRLSRILIVTLVLFNMGHQFASAEFPTASFNGLSRPNGKQVARLGNEWLLVTPDPSGDRAWLSSAPHDSPQLRSGDWDRALFLSPDEQGLFRSQGACAVPPSLAVDGRGRVHAAWGSGDAVWYARAEAKSAKDLRQRSAGLQQTAANRRRFSPLRLWEIWPSAKMARCGSLRSSALNDGSITLSLLNSSDGWKERRIGHRRRLPTGDDARLC